MSYTLEDLIGDCRQALQADPGPAGREEVCAHVRRACTDTEFLDRHLGDAAQQERNVLYEDPDLGFCILAHVYKGAKSSKPHDHGPSWAIYGQARGVTEMTDWRAIKAPGDGKPGKVEAVRTYKLEPGQARVYQEGDLHSPHRTSETRLIRVEGMNMDNVKRDKYEAVCHDIRTYYEEAALELVTGPPPGGRAAEAWFFEETAAGRTILAARQVMKAQDAPFPFWFYMAPGHR